MFSELRQSLINLRSSSY